MAWEKLGSTSVGGASTPVNNSWKEIGRTTLGSAGDSINVTSLPAKDNIMILAHGIGTGSTSTSTQFNGDTGANYTNRWSDNGGADGSDSSGATRIYSDNATASTNTFYVANIINKSDQEKLGIWDNVSGATAGAGNVPSRREMVGKWSNTSSQISSVNVFNGESGDYASGAEVVVLGCDNDEADADTNFWQLLSSTTLSSSQATPFTIPQFTTKKYLWIQYYMNASTDTFFQFGTGGSVDTGSNYGLRYTTNGAADSTTAPYSSLFSIQPVEFGNMFVINNSSTEKLVMKKEVGRNTAGAGNAPLRQELAGKWANTSGQIDIMSFLKGSATYYAGTSVNIWGAD